MMEPMMTVKQVAELLQFKPRTVRNWLANGKMAGVKVGDHWRVSETDLDAFLKRDEPEEAT
jgi:excisionase family DNA binding protein